jgi:putative restriction endonuclease
MDEKKLENKLYKVIQTYKTINVSDSFVTPSNKLEGTTGHGEKKLYIGNEGRDLRNFFGAKDFEVNCYFEKTNLEQFMSQIKTEYHFPQQEYRAKNKGENHLSSLYLERLNMVNLLPNFVNFKIKEQSHLKPPRVYVNSSDKGYEILRNLGFDEITKIVIYKVTDDLKNYSFIFHLYVDYESKFGDVLHPTIVREEENNIQNSKDIDKTEKLNLVVSRVGQGDFRKKLLKDSRFNFCPITNIKRQDILIASHIKPWSVSSNNERLDVYNGFLLTPTFDKLFDKGFITFDQNKKLIISNYLDEDTVLKLNIKEKVIDSLPIKNREKYLKYHYQNIFKRI